VETSIIVESLQHFIIEWAAFCFISQKRIEIDDRDIN